MVEGAETWLYTPVISGFGEAIAAAQLHEDRLLMPSAGLAGDLSLARASGPADAPRLTGRAHAQPGRPSRDRLGLGARGRFRLHDGAGQLVGALAFEPDGDRERRGLRQPPG
jgi:hypothetical protein